MEPLYTRSVMVEIDHIFSSRDRISDKNQLGWVRSKRAEIRQGFFSARPAFVVTGEQSDGLVHDTVAVRQYLRSLGNDLHELPPAHDLVIHEAAGFTSIRFQAT